MAIEPDGRRDDPQPGIKGMQKTYPKVTGVQSGADSDLVTGMNQPAFSGSVRFFSGLQRAGGHRIPMIVNP